MIDRTRISFAIFLIAATIQNTAGRCAAQIKLYPQRIQAPSLAGAGEWINTAGPLELKDLRGKFVILDFWTYCCINCMHILPELKKLEEQFPRNLVVIGVHSAKFATERDAENIREAVLRYEIEHPVVNDANLLLWRKYAVDVWPSLRIIDPEGYVIAHHSGEIEADELARFLNANLSKYRRRRVLDETPIRFDLERYAQEATPLKYPGKVLADPAGERLFIADSGNNRIVVASLAGQLLDTIGSGAVGQDDGSFEEATFDHPNGMALDGDNLYVADTENHLIRRVNLTSRRVTTTAGNGKQARVPLKRARTTPTWIPLASPWDLWIHDQHLYIAMAGQHQIWRMNLENRAIGPYAGNGVEDIVDGPLLPRTPFLPGFAAFAQPSGLTSDGNWLYVADSEGSSIRAVPFDVNGQVRTVVGTAGLPDRRLFTFGDRDGTANQALLQHPIGVAYADGSLFVADTYNHKIKQIKLQNSPVVSTFVGGDAAAGNLTLNEPAGVSVARGILYVADTNNHRVVAVDLGDASSARILKIDGLEPPTDVKKDFFGPLPSATVHDFGSKDVRAEDGAVNVQIDLSLPLEYEINAAAPMSFALQVAEPDSPFDPAALNKVQRVENPAQSIQLKLPVADEQGKSKIRLSLVFYYCEKGADAVCRIGSVRWTGEVAIGADAQNNSLRLQHSVD